MVNKGALSLDEKVEREIRLQLPVRENLMRRIAAVIATLVATLALGTGVANADAWPPDPGEGSPVRPVDVTSFVLTPDNPAFWNPSAGLPRIISPYGDSTKIVCTGFRRYEDCWQADREGNPHKLTRIFDMSAFGSLAPVPAPFVFIYPNMIPGM